MLSININDLENVFLGCDFRHHAVFWHVSTVTFHVIHLLASVLLVELHIKTQITRTFFPGDIVFAVSLINKGQQTGRNL